MHAHKWYFVGAGADRGGRRGRGGGRGGRGGRGSSAKPKSKEELDADLDGYFMKDSKTAAQRLDADMDAYMAAKGKASAEEQPVAEADGAGEAADTEVAT